MLEIKFTIPGRLAETVPLSESRMIIGTLLSNHVVLRATGIDPIHAMLEEIDGKWMLTDLGSSTGVRLNGKNLEVESEIKANDKIEIGGLILEIGQIEEEKVAVAPAAYISPPEIPAQMAPTQLASKEKREPSRTVAAATEVKVERRREEQDELQPLERKPRKEMLFSPRTAHPAGDVLETVAYWGDTILEVDMFHQSFKGFEFVSIGDPTKAHFIAAGKDDITKHVLAVVKPDGYKVRLLDGMEARVRKSGKVEKVTGNTSLDLGRRDIAHIKYGAVKYFLMFIRPPSLDLPRSGTKDPFFIGLMSFALLIYLLLIPTLWITEPKPREINKDDVWTIINVPEKQKKPEPEKKVAIEKIKEKIPEKPPEKPKPPPPKPPEPQPKKPNEPQKPKPPKEAVKPEPPKPALKPEPPKPQPTEKQEGMASTGSKNPDFKLAGPKTKAPLGIKGSGGPKGMGNGQIGGARKGTGPLSIMGVEGVNNNKASGVNLSKLGVGVGKIFSKTGEGAIYTNFKNSAGGGGGGMGSASKNYGFGGMGTGGSLGMAGTGTAVNNFGSGSGGYGSGQGGTGGLGGAGLGKGFGTGRGTGGDGRGRANVSIPSGDPVTSGGLTPQEIMAVIRANLNQIRHCYETLLQRKPNSAGKINVNFVIALNGRVSTSNISMSTIPDPVMKSCVTGTISRWKFPNPRGGTPVTVTYPFVFNPM